MVLAGLLYHWNKELKLSGSVHFAAACVAGIGAVALPLPGPTLPATTTGLY
jgi:hypothetical protein